MNKLKWLAVLIAAAMIIIAGFQVYWLRDNYRREQAALITQTDILFKDMVRVMQDSAMQTRVRLLLRDTTNSSLVARRVPAPGRRGQGTGRFVNVIRTLRQDSLIRTRRHPESRVFFNMQSSRGDSARRTTILDSINPESIREIRVVTNKRKDARNPDSKRRTSATSPMGRTISPAMPIAGRDSLATTATQSGLLYIDNERGDRVMIRIDSLFQDTLSVDTVRAAFGKTIAHKYPGVPFHVSWVAPDTMIMGGEFRGADFEPESRYKMELGNSMSYLLRRISMPILFSFFLVGLTLFSFILLYRSLARQQRLARLKNDFISNMTHELKTPIATVGVAIEALRDFNAISNPEKTKEYLDISRLELQRLGLLVDNVLKQSMFEAKKMEVTKEPVDMEELVNGVVHSLRLQLEKFDASVAVKATGNTEIISDRFHLVSVMLNLIDNSLKYSSGKPVINILLEGSDQELKIEVADNGVGIPEQYRTKVFEKFFRVPTGNRHNTKGHGLGLSYVAQVVKEHNGTIKVESIPGSGSRFVIILPKPTNQA